MTPAYVLRWLVECAALRDGRELYQVEAHDGFVAACEAGQAYWQDGWPWVRITPVWVEQGEGKRLLAAGVLQ